MPLIITKHQGVETHAASLSGQNMCAKSFIALDEATMPKNLSIGIPAQVSL